MPAVLTDISLLRTRPGPGQLFPSFPIFLALSWAAPVATSIPFPIVLHLSEISASFHSTPFRHIDKEKHETYHRHGLFKFGRGAALDVEPPPLHLQPPLLEPQLPSTYEMLVMIRVLDQTLRLAVRLGSIPV